MVILLIILIVLCAAILIQLTELRRFRTTEYEIKTDKVRREVRLAVLSDLHGFSYGRENTRLLQAVRQSAPEVILFSGDLIVTGQVKKYPDAADFCRELCKIAPVFFTFGNHETRAVDHKIPEFPDLIGKMEEAGVTFLNNAFSTLELPGEELCIYGLEVPLSFYQKRVHNILPEGFLEEKLGPCPEDRFTVLLAHNPAFAEDYFAWGADLTLSGHTHGGLVRFPGAGSLISPELTFFPKYDGGRYEKDGKHLIVSKGLGTHTFHVRIFDRAELLLIRLKER